MSDLTAVRAVIYTLKLLSLASSSNNLTNSLSSSSPTLSAIFEPSVYRERSSSSTACAFA